MLIVKDFTLFQFLGKEYMHLPIQTPQNTTNVDFKLLWETKRTLHSNTNTSENRLGNS